MSCFINLQLYIHHSGMSLSPKQYDYMDRVRDMTIWGVVFHPISVSALITTLCLCLISLSPPHLSALITTLSLVSTSSLCLHLNHHPVSVSGSLYVTVLSSSSSHPSLLHYHYSLVSVTVLIAFYPSPSHPHLSAIRRRRSMCLKWDTSNRYSFEGIYFPHNNNNNNSISLTANCNYTKEENQMYTLFRLSFYTKLGMRCLWACLRAGNRKKKALFTSLCLSVRAAIESVKALRVCTASCVCVS